jgi:hypothetical protein
MLQDRIQPPNGALIIAGSPQKSRLEKNVRAINVMGGG